MTCSACGPESQAWTLSQACLLPWAARVLGFSSKRLFSNFHVGQSWISRPSLRQGGISRGITLLRDWVLDSHFCIRLSLCPVPFVPLSSSLPTHLTLACPFTRASRPLLCRGLSLSSHLLSSSQGLTAPLSTLWRASAPATGYSQEWSSSFVQDYCVRHFISFIVLIQSSPNSMRQADSPISSLTDENTEEKQVALGHPALKWQKWNAHFSAQVHGLSTVLRRRGWRATVRSSQPGRSRARLLGLLG